MSKNDTAIIYTFNTQPTIDECPPTTKHLMLFIIVVRRALRWAIAVLDHERDRSHQYRRQARLLRERANPFDAARIATLEKLEADEIEPDFLDRAETELLAKSGNPPVFTCWAVRQSEMGEG